MIATTRKRGQNGTAPQTTVRVAIYTRQSVADDLEFNSLEAQRQAVEAYATSQKSLGWQILPERYDDHGFSGGTIERPAFRRLLADVEAGKIDIVAIHRLDRLSRSIGDFVRVMEFLEKHGVSLVSTTQAFDTSTSLGRMTVNLLATFATYERDMIRERTRDKMVASRRRGLWTGGLVPLGYRAEEKRLVMVPEEAAQVREIFKLYLGIGSVLEVASVLNRRGWKARSWKDPAGRPYDKAAVRRILTNPVYLGKVEYDGDLHDGVHEAIIDRETWDAVQELLTGGGCGRRTRGTSGTTTILQGLVRCGACGATMGYHAARKGPRAYGYLVCQTLQTRGASACSGSRVPVPDLEAFVVERIRAIGKDPRLVAETLRAARQQVRARRPEVQAELRRYERERGKLDLERRNLVEAVAGGKAGSPSLLQRLGEVEVKVSDLDGQLDRLQHEIAALEQGDIDEADLRAALASFTPLWEALNREEQARVLHLLLERVTYHAGKAEVEITFRPCGVRILAERGETP